MSDFTTFYCTWEIFPDKIDDCTTYYASMDEAKDKADMGPNCNLLGRWSDVPMSQGHMICQARSVKDIHSWFQNWSTMARIQVKPVVNDNEAREILLKQAPSWSFDYKDVGYEPTDGESMYVVKYKFFDDKRAPGMEHFAKMTEAQDKADAGKNRLLGRWHSLGEGSGLAVVVSPNAVELNRWTSAWMTMCTCEVIPVCTDKVSRAIVAGKPGYQQKLSALFAKMGMPSPK